MSAQGTLSWGRRARRQGLGADGNQGDGQGRDQSNRREENQQEGTAHHEESQSQHTAHSEPSIRNNRAERDAGEQVDPMFQKLIELLMQIADGRSRGSERVGSYTISDFLKLVTAMKNLGTTKFQGEPDPIKADEWLEMIEENFKATLCPEEYKKAIAAYYLEKEALAWWKSTERQLEESEVTWDLFKSEFLRKYFPQEARDRLERKFLTLYQGEGWSVRKYEAEFVKLRRYVYRGRDDEAAMMRYFLSGLNAEISSRLSVVEFPNLNRMIECAVNVEEKLGLVGASRNKSGNAGTSQVGRTKAEYSRQTVSQISGRGSVQTVNQNRSNARSGGCFKCGKTGHIARFCDIDRSANRTDDRAETRKRDRPAPDFINCFACGEKGHYATSCPNRATRSVVSVNRPRDEAAKAEPAAKKKATDSRVYALTVDEPESSSHKKGPIAGM